MNAVLLKHFENLALGHGGVGKLRDLILKLAASGKLTYRNMPQSTHAWHYQRLSDVAQLISGVTKGRNLRGRETIVRPYLRVANVQRWKLDLGEVKKIEITPDELEKYRLQTNDILMTEGGDWDKLGRAAMWNDEIQDCIHQNHVFRVRVMSQDISHQWIVLYINSPVGRAYFESAAKQTTNLASINITQLKGFVVAIPPLNEQHHIVAKVDELMRLCDLLEQSTTQSEAARRALLHSLLAAGAWAEVLENLPTLLQTPEDVAELRKGILELAVRGKLVEQDSREKPLMLSTTEGDFEIPLNWSWNIVQDAFDVSGGIQKTPQRQPVKNFYPYLRVANVQRNRLVLAEIHNFELFEGELEKYRLQDKDLLVVEGNGSEDEIGRCAIWNAKIENCVHQNHIMRVRARVSGIQEFTLLFFNSPTGIAEMKVRAITTSGLYTLSVGKIRTIQIPLPPLPEQHRIVAKVDQLMSLCDQLEAALHKSSQSLTAALASAVAQAV